jgi:REP element-mobilizing transposase RayT
MANTLTPIYLHIVFAVQGRQNLIRPDFKEEVYKYITGIVQNPTRRHKMIAINGVADHVHLLIGYNPSQALPDLIRDIKAASSGFINERRWIRGAFCWQQGYAAFSLCQKELDRVATYIANQEQHHAKRSFREEYQAFLDEYKVQYDPRYLFTFIDDDEKNESDDPHEEAVWNSYQPSPRPFVGD